MRGPLDARTQQNFNELGWGTCNFQAVLDLVQASSNPQRPDNVRAEMRAEFNENWAGFLRDGQLRS